MKNITFTEEFVPQAGNASVGTTVTIGAGVQLQDLYAAVAAQNQAVVIGYAHSVGAAGGYIQGGGHSPMGNWKGMSTDNTVEFQVVTASVLFPTFPASYCVSDDIGRIGYCKRLSKSRSLLGLARRWRRNIRSRLIRHSKNFPRTSCCCSEFEHFFPRC